MRFALWVALILIFFGGLLADNYYTDNQQSSGGDGSPEAPFNTIEDGLEALRAGDTLFIRGGTGGDERIYEEQFYLSSDANSGNSDHPIVVTAYNGEQVRIVLGETFSIYSDWWRFEGLIFDMEGKYDDIIRIHGDHITFRGCEITDSQKDGFDIDGASFTLIEHCRIHNFVRDDQYDAHGIILNGGEGNTIRNNTIYDCKGDCIQLYKDDQNWNTLIEGNDLYTTLGHNSENAIDVKATKGCTILNNKMHGFHDSEDSDGVALKVNKDSDNMLIEGNDIFECNGGFRITGGDTDSIIFRRNVVHDLHVDGGDSSKYGYGIQFEGVNDIRVVNNTFAYIPGPLFWIEGDAATNLTMKNNLFYKTNKFKGSAEDFNGANYIDYNGWFQCAETIPAMNDTHGEHPQFKDPAQYDYRLSEGSPAIDRGDPNCGGDYPGERIDLGAHEFQPSTGLQGRSKPAPNNFRLKQNYPNPFNPETRIEYYTPQKGHVTIRILNTLGQVLEVPVDKILRRGYHQLQISGKVWASGVYIYQLIFNGQLMQSRKMLLLR